MYFCKYLKKKMMIGNLESKTLKRSGLKGHLPESSSSSSSSSASRRLLRLSADKIVLKGKLINKKNCY